MVSEALTRKITNPGSEPFSMKEKKCKTMLGNKNVNLQQGSSEWVIIGAPEISTLWQSTEYTVFLCRGPWQYRKNSQGHRLHTY